MRQSSIIIHKGRKEEKYEIYIEDYVMSFLKEETGMLNLSEYFFYGCRENGNKRYIIYGAGRDKKVSFFEKYSLLDEIGCRLTQAGPVFFVREENGTYEIKGYEIFYQDNREMQSYLIERKKEIVQISDDDSVNYTSRNVYADESDTQNQKMPQSRTPHSAISIQLGIILVALIAIVINSTNSYDKMNQLNQSASEVLFAIENQEAEAVTEAGSGRDEIVVERDTGQENEQTDDSGSDEAINDLAQEEDVLKLVALENEEQMSDSEDIETSEAGEVENEENPNADSDVQEGVEALSRNVARYYEIEEGDTLYTISRNIYGDITYVEKICELNQISDPDHIRYGQKIILP